MERTTCKQVMLPNPTILSPTTTLAEALQTIRHSGVRYLPVVDEHGIFVGVFSSLALLRLLLPASSQLGMGIQPQDFNFMRPEIKELSRHFEDVAQEPVTQYLAPEIARCAPESSIMEAIYLITQHHTHVIVCEEDSNKFLGIITINGLFDLLSEQSHHA